MERSWQRSPKLSVGVQYFLYFGVMGVFLPYFNLYCYHIGFSGFQIGAISGIRTAATILFAVFWGMLADRYQIRRPLYILCNFISTGIWIGYLFTVDFGPMLLITVCYGIFYAPLIAFLEAFSMDVLGPQKTSYGTLRVWGSIGFILVVVLVGRAIDLYSSRIILGLILTGSAVLAIFSTRIPRITPVRRAAFIPQAKLLFERPVVVFLACAFLMLVSHGAYYGFFSIHLENLGYGRTFIGFTWALASTAEILVMINSHHIFRKFDIEAVLLFSFLIAAARWLALSYLTTPTMILISQISHAVTYGTFHMASILYIDKLTPRGAKTLGQAANNAATYGLGMMVGFFLNGYLYEIARPFTLFAVSSAIAFSAALIFGLDKAFRTQSRVLRP